ncbi:SAV_2336 N-terminal domain-related protein [Dapis sp. BLCC M229]|uniref:SAV_2336 N-terminal domain-related protein n=1 Tax=Dapis sp. BLCC M229 TaxID=3400188 RepID=UPI003CF3FDE3
MTQNYDSLPESTIDFPESKLQRLLNILQKVKSDLTGLELAEIIWLAVQMGETEQQQISTPTKAQKEEAPLPKKSSSETSPSDARAEETAEVYPYSSTPSSSTASITDTPIKVPAAPALRNTLALARAIRPLMQKIPSYTEQVLNETATVKRIVDENIWLPVLKPAPQKWLELGLVIEQSDSTIIWKQTIRELQEFLEYHGAFRDVRVWRLEMNGKKARLFPNINKNKQQRPRNPKEIIDPRGQRLILLVSDCVSSVWRDGSIYPLIRLWGSQGILTILQLFPERLWHRTALNQDIPVQLRALTPGAFNSQLKAEVQLDDELEEEELKDTIKVPVITLEAQSLATWSSVIAGFSSNTTAGFIFSPSLVDSEPSAFKLLEESITPEGRVSRFRATASKLARRLAGLIAGAPVSFPIVNLIQQTMLPQSNQVHVAEVFMSRLFKRVSSEKIEADYIYEFYGGVRELLLQSVPKSQTLLVIEKISEFLAQRRGLSSREFKALLVWSPDPQLRSFARLKTEILQQLEGNRGLPNDLENLEELLSQRKWKEIELLIRDDPGVLVQKLADFLYPLKSKHPDRYVREAAVDALGKIIEANITQEILLQTVEPIIQTLRKDEISQVRDAAKESLGKIYHKVKDQLNLPSPPPEVIQVDRTWRRENDREISRFYSEILSKRLPKVPLDKMKATELLTEFLSQSNDLDIRAAVARELGEQGSPTANGAVPELIKALDFNNKSSDRYLRQEAAITLGRLAPTTDIVDALNQANRQDVIKQVREAASQALEKIADLDNLPGKQAQRYLKLMHPDRLQKLEIDMESSIEILKHHSNDSNFSDEVVDLLIEAAEVLGSCQNTELIDDANNTLIKVLENENPNIVAAAADALGKIGNLQALKFLLGKLKKIERGDWIAREYIIRALGNLQSKLSEKNKDIDPKPVIDILIDKWRNDPISSVREEVEPALRKIYQITRHPIAYEALKRYPDYNKQNVENFYKKFFDDFPTPNK